MKNIGEQQIIIECPNTIFHLYIDSEDELSKVKVFMNNIKHVDSISLHDIYNWCNKQHGTVHLHCIVRLWILKTPLFWGTEKDMITCSIKTGSLKYPRADSITANG